jgi:hypothetical protein
MTIGAAELYSKPTSGRRPIVITCRLGSGEGDARDVFEPVAQDHIVGTGQARMAGQAFDLVDDAVEQHADLSRLQIGRNEDVERVLRPPDRCDALQLPFLPWSLLSSGDPGVGRNNESSDDDR